MNITCAIIDDEPLAIDLLKSYVLRTPFLKLENTFSNAIDATDQLTTNPVNLVFCDIQMPDLDGLSLARMLPETTRIIFTSIALPCRWTATEIPPPKWQTIRSKSSYFVRCSLAKRRAMARWFNACQIVIFGMSGEPVMRATSSSSSTTPGSAMKARQPGSKRLSSEAMRQPKLQA